MIEFQGISILIWVLFFLIHIGLTFTIIYFLNKSYGIKSHMISLIQIFFGVLIISSHIGFTPLMGDIIMNAVFDLLGLWLIYEGIKHDKKMSEV